jgi:hypothetical protein
MNGFVVTSRGIIKLVFFQWEMIFYILIFTYTIVLRTFRDLTDTGIETLVDSIIELGGVFHHAPLLVQRVWPSDNAPAGALYVVINGNHRFYLFTYLYP